MNIPHYITTPSELTVLAITTADAQPVYELIQASRKDLLNLTWAKTEVQADTLRWIMKIVADQGKTHSAWVIRFNGEVAGVIEFRYLENNCTQVGYWLGSKFRRKGIMQTVASSLIDREAPFKAILAKIRHTNTHSARILSTCKLIPYAHDTEWTYYMRPQDQPK